MSRKDKQLVVTEIKEKLSDAEAVILVDYRGLSVKAMTTLRADLRAENALVNVYKNSLTEIALREAELPEMGELLEGPTAFVFVEGDPVAPAKILTTFAKENPTLELKGALLGSSVIDHDGIVALSKLPSREELLGKLLGTLQNPLRGIVTVASGPARGLVTALDAVAQQKAAA